MQLDAGVQGGNLNLTWRKSRKRDFSELKGKEGKKNWNVQATSRVGRGYLTSWVQTWITVQDRRSVSSRTQPASPRWGFGRRVHLMNNPHKGGRPDGYACRGARPVINGSGWRMHPI